MGSGSWVSPQVWPPFALCYRNQGCQLNVMGEDGIKIWGHRCLRTQLFWGLVEEHDHSHVEWFLGSIRDLAEFRDCEFPVLSTYIAINCVCKWKGLTTWFLWAGFLLGGRHGRLREWRRKGYWLRNDWDEEYVIRRECVESEDLRCSL